MRLWVRLLLFGAAVLAAGVGLWAALRDGSAAGSVTAAGGSGAAASGVVDGFGLGASAELSAPTAAEAPAKTADASVSVVAGAAPGPSGFVGAAAEGSGGSGEAAAESKDSEGLLVAGPKAGVSGCGAGFVAPGDVLVLRAEGFAADAAVSFAGKAVTATGASLPDPAVAATTADDDGAVSVEWSVPGAPAASADAVPRGYAVRASGANAAGGTHTAYVLALIVAYPGTKPCAKPDAATVVLGATVQVDVLANDVAPSGGSLDASSVELPRQRGGTFAADAST